MEIEITLKVSEDKAVFQKKINVDLDPNLPDIVMFRGEPYSLDTYLMDGKNSFAEYIPASFISVE
jgi:hypothetical protein